MAAHVVVGADGSAPSQTAVEWAAEDAARRGCDLRIVHVYEPTEHYAPSPEFQDSVREYGQDVLEKAAERARGRAPWTEVSTSLVSGRVAEVLRREAEDAEQVVVGSRGLGGFAGLLLGSVTRSRPVMWRRRSWSSETSRNGFGGRSPSDTTARSIR